MKIHFVCTGNTFRSRLAEAYLKSKKLSGLVVSSSGIEAWKNLNGPVCDYTKKVLKKENIIEFMSKDWITTTKEILDSQDLVIFMTKKQFKFCINKLNCNLKKYLIFDIKDVLIPLNFIVERKFKEIKKKIDMSDLML